MPLSLLPVSEHAAVTGPGMKQQLCRGLVAFFCFVIFETCVSGLLGRMRIFFQDTCYHQLGITAARPLCGATLTCVFLRLSRKMERLGTKGRGIQGAPVLQAVFWGPAGSSFAGP